MSGFDSNFTRLQSLEGLAGMCAVRGAQIVSNHLPLSDRKTVELVGVVAEMLDGYLEVEREIRRVVLGYDRGAVLIACRGDRRVLALVDERADCERVMRGMEGFLESHLDFLVRRPRRKKRVVEDPDRPPISTKDEWGRRTVSLHGLRAMAPEKIIERRMLPLPPTKKRKKGKPKP